VKGQRSRSNANVTGLWNGHPVNVLLPFRETNCSPFSAFGGLKIRFMPIHEPHCPIVLIQGQSSKIMRKDQIRGHDESSKVKIKRERQASSFEIGVLVTYFCRFVKRPVARFLHFGGLKIRFMPSHEPHCPIVLIHCQSSKVMRKDQIRDQGERSKVKIKRERHRPLKWASWKRTFAVSWNDL